MEHVNDALSKLIPPPRQPDADEYVGEDGLIYCKHCKTPRQFVFENFTGGKPAILPKLCKCRAEAAEKQRKEEEERERRERIENARHKAISVPSYRGYRFSADDGKTPKTTEICKNYVRNFAEFSKTGQGLLLYGDVGTGKTFYALCIANALIDREYRVLHTSLADVVKMAQDFDNAESHFMRLMWQKCIVIDDLGTERATSFAEEQIYKFIDGCNTHGVALIVTTNYTPKELEAAAADTSDLTHARIYSRLLEKCFPVRVNDIKRREANTAKNKATVAELLGINKK